MKTSTSTKIVTLAKSLITFGSNVGIFVLTVTSITSLVLLLSKVDLGQVLPKGAEMTFSGYEAFGGANAFVLTFVTGNTLMTYGLMQLKQFVKNFKEGDLFTNKTISFLQKGAIFMALVGAIHGVTELVINPTHILLNFSVSGWLLLASLVLSYIKKHFANKVA